MINIQTKMDWDEAAASSIQLKRELKFKNESQLFELLNAEQLIKRILQGHKNITVLYNLY